LFRDERTRPLPGLWFPPAALPVGVFLAVRTSVPTTISIAVVAFAAHAARARMAVDVNDVDGSSVIAGGATTANFPQAARNFRRSASEAISLSEWNMELSYGAGHAGKFDLNVRQVI
jgi:hypothetical protein